VTTVKWRLAAQLWAHLHRTGRAGASETKGGLGTLGDDPRIPRRLQRFMVEGYPERGRDLGFKAPGM
jgi:hypothetical protein